MPTTLKTLVSSHEQFRRLLNEIQEAEYANISLDVETSGKEDDDALNPWAGWLVGLGVAIKPETGLGLSDINAFYIPIYHTDGVYDTTAGSWAASPEGIRALLDAIPSTANIVMHNAKFDLEWLEYATGFYFNEKHLYDPMLEMWLADVNSPKGLKYLTAYFFPHESTPVEFRKLQGVGKNKKRIEEVDIHAVADYCMDDVINTLRVHEKTHSLLIIEGGEKNTLMKVYRELEMPMLRLLANMELRGVQIDKERLDKLALSVAMAIDTRKESLERIADINWNSSQQVVEFLQQEGVSLPDVQTPSGKQKLDAAILSSLRGVHEAIDLLLDHRMLKKINDYVENIYKRVDNDFRIHCQFQQTGTRSSRLSCTTPNLQNIPARRKKDMPVDIADMYMELRHLFIGTFNNEKTENQQLIVSDLSQIEFRMAAHFSCDPVLVKAYKNNHDFHKATADAVTDGDRTLAKNINFGYLFGQRAKGLSNLTGMPIKEAEKFYAGFEKAFRGLYMWDMKAKAHARTNGFAETILGHKRYLPDIKSGAWGKRAEAERQAISTIIQGSAADYLKIAMLNIDKRLRERGFYIVLQVHDEIVLDTDGQRSNGDYAEAMEIIQHEMEHALELIVPVKTTPMVVDDWGAAK